MRFFSLSLLFLILSWGAHAELKVPSLSDPVMDQAGLISAKDQRFLRELILNFHSRQKGQIQVLTLKDLGGLPIEQASIQITDQWKLGNAQRDDGVLILVAAQERKIRIEVGQGLEGVLPDIKAKRIISDVMAPLFRQASPSQGILLGTYQVMKTIDPEFESGSDLGGGTYAQKKQSLGERFEGLFILLFVILMILSNIFRPRRSFWGGRSMGGWGGGGFGGGFGGGGGWSGGGGGFSGGGASGDW